ncbi:protein lethal essential for life-like protein [Lasius niger]|uniref:Protein lethal essential for life-like protein n=1 Tax=Lasius niger TaxID=67767 RepID=A0A0J7K2I6_LASNI|nr:protein lethal essential for life-like protein [Lasius niger]
MSLIPLLFSDWWEDLEHPHSLLDQNFGLNVRPKQFLLSPARTNTSLFLDAVPRRNPTVNQLKALVELIQQRENNGPPPPVNKDDFQIVLDVQQFEPHEIEVKIVDNYLVVTAKHEDKRDEHGWVSRQFVRKCKLPEDSNNEQLTSRLSTDGLLTIVAPKKQPLKDEMERTIQIERTGKPFVNEQRENSKKSKQSDEEKQTE